MLKKTNPKTFNVAVRSIGEDVTPLFYRKIELPDGRISDILPGEEQFWNNANPVLINTPPDSGKSTWVRKHLIPLAKENGKNIIVASNRAASSIQMKKDLMDESDDPRRNLLTTEGIRNLEDFGHVRILTTQSLPRLVHDPSLQAWINNVGHIVIDEAHIFASDAMFNENCDYYLKLVTERFRHAVRIYMTGTVEDVLVPLANAEDENFRYNVFPPQWQLPREFFWYHRPASFDAYELFFFDNLDDLIPLIKETPQDKWIIFSDSKEKGQAFAGKLPSVWYVDATRKSGKQWDLLMDKEHFEEQVMVTTAVLDSGVNVDDRSVKNIAIVADNPTALIQMLGRRRLKGKEKLNLYVADLSQNKIARRLQTCDAYLSWYARFDSTINPELKIRLIDEIWKSEDHQLRKLFRLSKGQLYANESARHVLQRRRVFYQRIVSGETTFRREVGRWLGKEIPSTCKEISSEALDAFCREHIGRCLNTAEREELKDIVFGLSKQRSMVIPREARRETVTPASVNKLLRKMDLPYQITSTNKQTWWLCWRDTSEAADAICGNE